MGTLNVTFTVASVIKLSTTDVTREGAWNHIHINVPGVHEQHLWHSVKQKKLLSRLKDSTLTHKKSVLSDLQNCINCTLVVSYRQNSYRIFIFM